MSVTRRDFLAGGAAMASTALLPSVVQAAPAASRFTIGLSQYSLRALFQSGTLDPLDYPQFSVDTFGIRTLDLWEGGLPKMDDTGYLEKLRDRAAAAGTELFLLMTGALDASPARIVASRQAILPALDRANRLGCEYVRIFLKAPGKQAAAAVQPCVEALKPLADAAADRNLTIAIEPGASLLTQRGTFLAQVAMQLNHNACRLMPDFGKQKNNVYTGTAAMLPHTATISCKMHSFDENGNQPDFDYARLMEMITASAYQGILAIEWEGRKLEPIAGVNASRQLLERSLAATA